MLLHIYIHIYIHIRTKREGNMFIFIILMLYQRGFLVADMLPVITRDILAEAGNLPNQST